MQHLSRAYEGLPLEDIKYRKSIDRCLRSNHGSLYQNFVSFPIDHGWEIDGNYRLNATPPMNHNEAFKSKSEPGPSNFCPEACMDKDTFCQAWLFFGIIRCVIRTDGEILSPKLLVADGMRLNTGDLPGAVETWSENLRTMAHCHESRKKAEMRCIEAVQILTLARRVIIANLAVDHNPSNQDDKRDRQALCLMILGETLSAALAHTMRSCEIDIRGWQVDENGWGPPLYVLNRMNKEHWCLKLQETLQGQLGRSATLLYVTLSLCASQNHPPIPAEVGLKCTKYECKFIEARHGTHGSLDAQHVNPDREYQPRHYHGCPSLNGGKEGSCRMLGPDEDRLRSILDNCEEGEFPLLRYRGKDIDARVELETWSPTRSTDLSFVTISHVWAHGLGNENEAKVWKCQLDHIRSLIGEFHGSEESSPVGNLTNDDEFLFWLDTLAIPPKESSDNEGLRLKAIRSIYNVFDSAEYGIIIDGHLLMHSAVGPRVSVGVRLLSSGWMRRLWTLQEAYVTKSLWLAGEESSLRDIDRLWREELDEDDTERSARPHVMEDSLAASVELKLSQNMMEVHRKSRQNNGHLQAAVEQNEEFVNTERRSQNQRRDRRFPALALIAGAWNSATYRNIGRPENETLALASLLNLSIPEKPKELSGENPAARRRLCDELMRNLWKEIMEKHRAIPTGMIFTPGERMSLEGYGWAPRTWMAGKDESHPFPLNTSKYTEELTPRGLIVQYPGFRIYAKEENYETIFDVNQMDHTFMFSASAGLSDWYVVESLDTHHGYQAIFLFLKELKVRVKEGPVPQLGIILSRLRPGEFPPEVALLVEIESQDQQSQNAHSDKPKDYAEPLYCKIICRVQVSRVSMLDRKGSGSTKTTPVLDWYQRFDSVIVAESLEENQDWCVDGYIIQNKDLYSEDGKKESQGKTRTVEATDRTMNGVDELGLPKISPSSDTATSTNDSKLESVSETVRHPSNPDSITGLPPVAMSTLMAIISGRLAPVRSEASIARSR